jgi:hypothetical protein
MVALVPGVEMDKDKSVKNMVMMVENHARSMGKRYRPAALSAV